MTRVSKIALRFVVITITLGSVMAGAQDFTYTNNNGAITITGYTGPGGVVTIPDTINGVPVTSIGDRAFWYNNNVTSITISSGVKGIGDYAFDYCTSLTNTTIPNSVTSIGDYAFDNCTNLTTMDLPNTVTSIESYAFNNCTSLTSLTILSSVTTIGDYTGLPFAIHHQPRPSRTTNLLTPLVVNGQYAVTNPVSGTQQFDKGTSDENEIDKIAMYGHSSLWVRPGGSSGRTDTLDSL